jgi:sensor histidine kinase YesM
MNGSEPAASSIPWRRIAAFWCVAAAFETCQSIFMLHVEGRHGGEPKLIFTEFIKWLPWALATPFVIGLARRYPIIRTPSVRGITVHVLTFVGITLCAEAWSATLQVLFNPWGNRHLPVFWDTFSTTLVFQAVNCLAAYALILTITYLVESRDNIARQAAETARLNEELSRAQLAALRRQLEPHFLFNALHSISGLVRDNCNATAVRMIVGLSEFLRHAIKDGDRQQVTLAEEVDYLRRYIEIQQARFGERLHFSVEIAPDTLHLTVPSLLLQPLVENAIKHGLGKRAAGGKVRVKSARDGQVLRLSVYNDGPAFPPDWETNSNGVGLANLRTRLRILYGTDAALSERRVGRVGVEVIVTLPPDGA